MLEFARLGEGADFGSLRVSGHHGTADGYLPSLTVALGAMAAITRRARLGMRGRVVDSVVSGTPEAVAERLRPWVSALDRRHFVLAVRLHYPGVPLACAAAAVELFVARVAPLLGVEPGAVPDA
jgi:alkanesulfonate monooxygenase SsuD/methylene tetrahydromethanopterin reductase-like flavin-dependent oxidoreductase (luciferase family)